jgi:hypothetical protein
MPRFDGDVFLLGTAMTALSFARAGLLELAGLIEECGNRC